MSIDPKHLRALITDVLIAMDLHSPAAVELLMLTAAQESHCGKYLTQINGPARGIFQMEPATHRDLHANFLKYHPRLLESIQTLCPGVDNTNSEIHMRGNLVYQIIVARLNYYRFPEALPRGNDLDALAAYYKKYWNTEKGKATVEEALDNYRRYAV